MAAHSVTEEWDDEMASLEPLDPSLENLFEQETARWVLVGGKGGVGKTTTSCCVAMEFARRRTGKVLLISTDPAHNISDAFGQKFGGTPTPVHGVANLFAMEVDPQANASKNIPESIASNPLFKDLATAMPGIDEAMSFAEVLKLVKTLEFSVVVFDTAPTGHTLRLLQFPALLEKAIDKLGGLKSKFGGLLGSMAGMLGDDMPSEGELTANLEKTRELIDMINREFKNPELTTFVCVLIPEFLSIYETERMVQELHKLEIDVHNVVVNQVLYPPTDAEKPCRLCAARAKMQKKYIDQITELYEGLFHVTKMPLLEEEVRGVESLSAFSKMLVTPYQPEDH
eukprot:CAMPEP_0177648298 /NCGR_PEP_ID=MMETSP0447-20121125/10755_1 /TAXON_ID=0 /ORGANISM="Stygamoeba regulata, Strain BSH-02190019" /LENGTH=340 /DNA_ID=CAMNT_0019150933 /DNA_START=142 /DNA_END=1164 /DNA_ORIENTATION=-